MYKGRTDVWVRGEVRELAYTPPQLSGRSQTGWLTESWPPVKQLPLPHSYPPYVHHPELSWFTSQTSCPGTTKTWLPTLSMSGTFIRQLSKWA